MVIEFWDQKNHRIVMSDQLMKITLVDENEKPLGSIGYKSEKCPSYQNWDMWCNPHDLIFKQLVD